MNQKIDPELHECASCSEKPGSPTLCARCYRARSKARSEWHGRMPGRGKVCSRCPLVTVRIEPLERLAMATKFDVGGGWTIERMTVREPEAWVVSRLCHSPFRREYVTPSGQVIVEAPQTEQREYAHTSMDAAFAAFEQMRSA